MDIEGTGEVERSFVFCVVQWFLFPEDPILFLFQARVRQVERDFLRDLQGIVSDAVESLLEADELDLPEVEEPLYEYQENMGPEMRRYRESPSVVMEEVRALAQRHQVQVSKENREASSEWRDEFVSGN
mmetsp:Transcript_34942/g.138331  ORF Transcript_34942/g.138331 Transcript_34942/m.138331 type:complete len:129 (-) Transcript_34942:2918-3304(-)